MEKLFLFFIFFAVTLQLNAQDRLTGKTFTTRSEILSRKGMAATSQPLATQAALDILKKGVQLWMPLSLPMRYSVW